MEEEFEYYLEILQEYAISIINYNYNLVLSIFTFLLSIITNLSDRVEQLEQILIPYIKTVTNFIYLLPEIFATAFDFVINFSTFYNRLIVQLNRLEPKTRVELKCQLYISILGSMVVLFLFAILYYKRKNYLLTVRNNELEKNPALNMCCICKNENSNVILIPCAHLCVCIRCFYMMKKNAHGALEENCPMCRTPIESEIRIY